MEQAVDRLIRWPLEMVGLLIMGGALFVPELAFHAFFGGLTLALAASPSPAWRWVLAPLALAYALVLGLAAALGRKG